jgi:enoyl-[acyl-carrier-protein] reductase (NADH)
MLARIKANEIGRTGIRMAAVLAGSQLTVAAAKVGDHAKLAGECAGGSAFHLAVTLGQTAWSMLDACVVGQMVHIAGAFLASDSSYSTIQTVAGIIGHEVVGHLVSFVFQMLS